jgi:hypothetical protein
MSRSYIYLGLEQRMKRLGALGEAVHEPSDVGVARGRHDRRRRQAGNGLRSEHIAELFWTAHTDSKDAWRTEYRFTGT